MKQREAKKPSFPDFGSFGVPTAQTVFCGFCFNLSVFYNFILCFYHYNLILRTAQSLQSLQSFFPALPALVVCQSLFIFAFKTVPIFLFFCVRSFGHDGSNRWLHSGWHFRGYLLKHRFRSAQTFLIVPTMPSCSRFTNVPL